MKILNLHSTLDAVTQRIRARSAPTRAAYLQRLEAAANRPPGAERIADVGALLALVDSAQWDAREVAQMPIALAEDNGVGMGRELFAAMRRNVTTAEEGACSWL